MENGPDRLAPCNMVSRVLHIQAGNPGLSVCLSGREGSV
jgi:hypothetical protein